MSTRFRGMELRRPAFRWTDALPTGNGIVGAMVYGDICDERVLLNHDDLWLRTDKSAVPDVSHHLPQVRQWLLAGEYAKANKYLSDKLIEAGYTHQVDPYHPLGDLRITTTTQQPFTHYRRRLDFSTGEVVVSWRDGDEAFERRVFVSCADDAVVLRFRGDNRRKVNCTAALIAHITDRFDHGPVDKAPITFESLAEGRFIQLTGTYHAGGQFGAVGKVIAHRGRATPQPARMVTFMQKGHDPVKFDQVVVEDADEVLVLVKVFANEDEAAATPRLKRELDALDADYDQLLARHVQLHRELFERVSLNISTGGDATSNEQTLLHAYDGEVPAHLIEQLADYGRFLLICSSSPGGWPANLQGIWNGDYAPEWSSDIHNDENIQMNYWQALPGSLPEMTLPFFDYFERCLDDCRDNARKIYNCRGILTAIAQSTDGRIHPGVWVNWTAGAGWLAQLFYDYYLFTGDCEFLRDRAVPFMREVAMFYEDFTFEGEDGRLVFAPSLSPENRPDLKDESQRCLTTINATMDVAVAREVLTNLCDACETLGIESENVTRWRAMIGKLPPYDVNEDGAIREWLWPGLNENYHHRHQSHIYGLFPGWEITAESDPKMYEACRIAVEKRLVVGIASQTSWSLAHMANIYARLGDGDRALECLELMARSGVGDNLLSYHNSHQAQGVTMYWGYGVRPPFQIDANFGLTAAVYEMVLFSRPGWLKLAPAIPSKWPQGEVRGLSARGGVKVDIAWQHGSYVDATLTSTVRQTVTCQWPSPVKKLTVTPADALKSWRPGDDRAEINLPANAALTLHAAFQ